MHGCLFRGAMDEVFVLDSRWKMKLGQVFVLVYIDIVHRWPLSYRAPLCELTIKYMYMNRLVFELPERGQRLSFELLFSHTLQGAQITKVDDGRGTFNVSWSEDL